MLRRSFRRAVAASVLLHAALAVLLVVCLKPDAPPLALDTRTDGDAHLSIRFADEPAVEVAVAPAPAPKPETVPPTVEAKRDVEEPRGSRPPLAQTTPIPRTLPPEMLAILKRPSAVGGEVVDVAVTPTAMVAPPVSHASGSPVPAPGLPSTPPIHGPLPDAKSIVYVLDASGSMGEWGKLAAARKALVATLRQQPPGARFQVVVYNGTARALIPDPSGRCVLASAENVRLAEERLAAVEPVGRSDHARGLQMAMNLRPDFVLILTDADDLAAAKLRGVVAQAARPAVLCVAKVTADGVGVPREWK